MAAFVPHRPNKYFHVTASNGIVSNSPYTTGGLDCISNRIGSGIRSAMQMSSRYVRCAPNAVEDRTRDHHADDHRFWGHASGSSSSGKTPPIVPSTTAIPLAAAPYRASGLVLWRKAAVSRGRGSGPEPTREINLHHPSDYRKNSFRMSDLNCRTVGRKSPPSCGRK
jgi:hypothetical protein